ncbi:uncharacterized protein FIBRA_05243 [Fibroporia radiculosa]|uniref:Homeobox domain-containing protein n=1 Tax=Fibroporia radiculosa TaxID=599839 RepID=J4HX71_9APHY|nr:uncharacterized protein FIBRA_05243 [Fibroporia radiculosa]CCM03122.1 predicted protein [Fibroporia radiculosa]
MSTFHHTVSESYLSSVDSSSIASVAPKHVKSAGEIPFVRRRLLHEQTVALLAVFELKTHPSKDERVALAQQLGMELKTVSAWFQNRRRSHKKKLLVWNRGSQENRYEGSAYPASSSRHLSRVGSTISLDCIASSREKPMVQSGAPPLRPPLTPRRPGRSKNAVSPTRESTNLWDHIPSSPPALPSSPGAESMRLAAIPERSRRLRSLEWACAKARAGRSSHDNRVVDCDVPPLVLDGSKDTDMYFEGDDTETEEYEAITPDVSSMQLTTLQASPGVLMAKKDDAAPPADMEAAMALLGFKVDAHHLDLL